MSISILFQGEQNAGFENQLPLESCYQIHIVHSQTNKLFIKLVKV
jgi:hypothetical protein